MEGGFVNIDKSGDGFQDSKKLESHVIKVLKSLINNDMGVCPITVTNIKTGMFIADDVTTVAPVINSKCG